MSKQLQQLAILQLQKALIKGEQWAIKHVLDGVDLPGEKKTYQWDIKVMGDANISCAGEITAVSQNTKKI